MKNTLAKGFTLIELLIVIAIIALLTGIIITNLSSSRAKSRDAQRVSDIAQIQLAIEQYFDRCGAYPATYSTNNASSECIGNPSANIKLGNYISQLPLDPSTNGNYDYAVNSATNPIDYVLHAKLETKNDALTDSLRSVTNPSTPSWFSSGSWACYNSASANAPYDYCVGPK